MVKSSLVRILVALVMCMAFLAVPAATVHAGAQANAGDRLIQFTSGGHVLGFGREGVIIGSGSHMLRTNFINASAVAPQAENGIAAEQAPGIAPLLGRVTYRNVWDGVTVVYEATPGAIVKSTYYVNPTQNGVPVERIRLGYNRPLSIDEQGNLVIAYDTGTMVESAPVAWQEIDEKRVPVGASFILYGEREAGFSLRDYEPGIPVVIDPALTWNTFLGGSGYDDARGIAIDGSGNIYVAGVSLATWQGTTGPVRAYTGTTGTNNAFAAKLSDNGTLIWNTFLGSSAGATGTAIAVDGSGNVYVAGIGGGVWSETPVRAYTPGASGNDAFAAKLGNDGAMAWYTFLGGTGGDEGRAIAVYGSTVYVVGSSYATWPVPAAANLPVRAYSGTWEDAFAAKLDSSGTLLCNTFLGGTGNYDYGQAIAIDGSGNVYVAGESDDTWESPVRAHSGSLNRDAFAAKLDGDLNLVWNTFLGGSGTDYGYAIAVYGRNVYVAGDSDDDWGDPVQHYTLGWTGSEPDTHTKDAFAAKLNSTSGVLTWNTFLGGNGEDYGYAVAVDSGSNVYVAGTSKATWGTPWRAYSYYDAFAAKLSSLGALTWNGFMGSNGVDEGYGIAVDGSGLGNVYVTGASYASWEQDCSVPVRDYSPYDAFVAKTTYTAKAICNYRLLLDRWYNCVITGTDIAVDVPYGTDVTALVAYFVTTGASITVGGTPQVSGTTYNNFTNPVIYTVTADDASTQEYTVTVTVEPSTATDILTFDFNGLSPAVTGTVNDTLHTVALTVPFATNVTNLVPTITLSAGATVSPLSGVGHDFTIKPQTYTVTAEDTSTQQAYAVTVTVAAARTDTDIVTFNFNGLSPAVTGTVDNVSHTVALTVPFATNVTNLVPTITLSAGATVSPLSGVAHDFTTNPQTYTVTAEDTSTQQPYAVTVTVAAAPSTAALITYFNIAGQSGSTTIVDGPPGTVDLTMPSGTDVTGLAPTITVSTGATVSPLSGASENFTSPVLYTVTAEDGTTTKAYTVTVTVATPPTVTGITPSSGFLGQEELEVTITGTGFTDDLEASEAVYLYYYEDDEDGYWIEVYWVDVDSPTEMTGYIDISSDSDDNPPAVYGVELYYSDEYYDFDGLFEVTSGPTVTGINPTSGFLGQEELEVTITGTGFYEDFEDDWEVWLYYGHYEDEEDYWIEVYDVAFVSPTELTGYIDISSHTDDNLPGLYGVELYSADYESYGFDDLFTVTLGPTVTAIDPDSGIQGATCNVIITGTGFTEDFEVSEVVYLYYEEDDDYWWYVEDVVVDSSTNMHGSMTIFPNPDDEDPPAPTGSYGVGIYYEEDYYYDESWDGLFTVTPGGSSSVATVTSTTYTVGTTGGADRTITNVPFGTAKATFLAALTKGESHQTWNDAGIAATVVTGNTLVVTAQDTTTVITYTITVASDSAKDITAFSFPEGAGVITGTNIAVTVPFGTNRNGLTPTIVLSGGTVSPLSGVAQNFTSPVIYTVTAADASTKVYTVTVTVAPDPAKSITAFGFVSPAVTGVISGTNIAVTVPLGTNVTALVATFTSTGSSVKVGTTVQTSGTTANDFTNPVIYTVTAADATTQAYTVTVTVAPPPPTQSVNTATGTGTATFATSNGSITGLSAAASTACGTLTGLTGLSFPHGFFSYNITDITAGSTVTITIALPSNMPIGAEYWKCINGRWVNVTSLLGDNDGDNVLTLTITDGGLGDADGQINGEISDPGGPAIPAIAPVPAPAPRTPRASPALPRPLNPAQMSVKYLSVNPQQTTANQPVTIITNVVNAGDEGGNLYVALKINGQVEQSRMVSVGPQGTQPVKFTVTKAQPGTYTIDIGGQRGSFIVSGAGSRPSAGMGEGLLFVAAMAVIAILVILLIIISRRRLQGY
jgi:hypothetical protein